MVRTAVASLGHIQELAGDNAFLVFPDPASAMNAILNLYRAVETIADFPALRTGLHHGPALLRANRYFGTTVNMAARTAAQATRGEILCTTAVATTLSLLDNQTFEIAAVGSVKFKNLQQEVEMFSVKRLDTRRQRVVDPVCQMQVDKKSALADVEYEGQRYWFCSAACANRFAISPTDFV